MSSSPPKRKKWRRRVVLLVVVVLVLAVGGPFVFIHFIEGSAPAKLTLPSSTSATTTSTVSTSSSNVSTGSSSFAGDWNVGANSVAGYRVNEVLIGQSTTAVGRTEKIWGSVLIRGTTVTSGEFTVDMATVKSDQSERNAQFDGPIMDVSQYPTASLKLTSPIDVGSIPPFGKIETYRAQGALTMHGVTKSIAFQVSLERTTENLDVLADIPIAFSKWNIANPSVGGFVTTANSGTLEALIYLTKGKGNAPSTQGASAPSGPGGTPVTVPPTTVPPLKIN